MPRLPLTPDEFRRISARISELAARYLEELPRRAIQPPSTGAETERRFAQPLPAAGMGERALDALEDAVKHARAQNGRFFGYVRGSGDPVAATADLRASVLNNMGTAGRSGPAVISMERGVVASL